MNERVREQTDVATPLVADGRVVAPVADQRPVVVEFEESAVRSEPERPPASWPLHLLTWLFAAGIAGGVFGLAFLAMFGPPAKMLEGVPYEDLRPAMYLRGVLALGTSATTWWLLRKRRRAGAILAALVVASPQIPSFAHFQFHFPSLAFTVAVIACAVASWRELE